MFLNFHHHHEKEYGVYNLDLLQDRTEGYFSAGIHPKDANKYDSEIWAWLQRNTQHENCLAIGECGLDRLIPNFWDDQLNLFKKQLNWAEEIRKPVIIHCVRAFSEVISLTKKSSLPLIIHGFNKKKIIADELVQRGFWLSFGTAILDHVSLQEIIRDISIDKIFLETDNVALDIEMVYDKVAKIKKISIENVKEQMIINLNNIRSFL